MAQVIFPTSSVIPNTVPNNGNTVPISGLQAVTNHTEGFLYFAYAMENIYLGDTINFGQSVAPVMQINKVFSRTTGELYLEVIGYIKLQSNYATNPSGVKQWKLGVDRLPNNPSESGFNF